MKIVGVLVVLLSSVVLSQRRVEYSNDGWFYRSEDNLGAVPNDIPGGAVGVYLNNNNIETVRFDAFTDMTALTFIGLHNNMISQIDSDAFMGLGRVTEIWLQDNNLKRIKANMFKGLTSLTDLLLSNNPIETIETDAWMGLSNLKELYLHTTSLRQLWVDTFKGLDSLEELTLTNNKIFRIQDGAFNGLLNLKKLWLDSNDIKEVTYGTFLGLTNLQRIALHHNNLTEIIGGVFTGMFHLEVIDLDDNEISFIRSDAFRGLGDLVEVWLYNNKLKTFAFTTICDLPRPISLTLGKNPLTCDAAMCWLKQGYVTWLEFEQRTKEPDCDNGITWADLNCPREVDECADPGQVQNAMRKGSGPFKIGDEITYTCGFCYMGSKTITCGVNGQWSDLPVCRAVLCPDPGTVLNGRRVSDGPYTCSYLVGYECDEGYRLAGEAMLVCRGDATWNAPKPQCLPIPSARKLPDCKSNLEENRWLIIAVVAGVGGMFVAVIATATCMECCCNRRTKVKVIKG